MKQRTRGEPPEKAATTGRATESYRRSDRQSRPRRPILAPSLRLYFCWSLHLFILFAGHFPTAITGCTAARAAILSAFAACDANRNWLPNSPPGRPYAKSYHPLL